MGIDKSRLESIKQAAIDGRCIAYNSETMKVLIGEIERQAAEIVDLKDGNGGLRWALGEMKSQHKNLHRSLCARFGYVHDEKYWWRDDVSLEEHISKQLQEALAGQIHLTSERDLLKAEVERLRTAEGDAMTYKAGMENCAAQRDQLKRDNEALRKEIALLKPSPISTDKTTIGYTGCIICGQYTDHGGLQCPKLAARSLSMENQRIVPVDSVRVEHPLDALDRKLKP